VPRQVGDLLCLACAFQIHRRMKCSQYRMCLPLSLHLHSPRFCQFPHRGRPECCSTTIRHNTAPLPSQRLTRHHQLSEVWKRVFPMSRPNDHFRHQLSVEQAQACTPRFDLVRSQVNCPFRGSQSLQQRNQSRRLPRCRQRLRRRYGPVRLRRGSTGTHLRSVAPWRN